MFYKSLLESLYKERMQSVLAVPSQPLRDALPDFLSFLKAGKGLVTQRQQILSTSHNEAVL